MSRPGGERSRRPLARRSLASRRVAQRRSSAMTPPHVKDQGPPGSLREVPCCVSAALTVCFEQCLQESEGIELSLLYHYHYGRGSRERGGMRPRSGIHVARTRGICSRRLHPHPVDLSSAEIRPTRSARRDGARRKLDRTGARELSHRRLDDWKRALCDGIPLLLAFWYREPEYREIPRNGNTHPVPASPRTDWLHAVAVVGHDDGRSQFRVLDSRGRGWADEGYWYLPYEVAGNSSFTKEVYAIRVDRPRR